MEDQRFVILTEGNTHPNQAKLAAGLLRYRRDSVIALLDSQTAGQDAGTLMGVGRGIPIVAKLSQAIDLCANTLVLGITPPGGQIPADWRSILIEALSHGLDIISGMHFLLSNDPEWRQLAEKNNANIKDLRKVPEDLSVNGCQAPLQSCFRVHTVGTDCNCGKKVTALELDSAFRAKGYDSAFVATGQSGIAISGKGLAMDHIISDFVSGAAEKLVLENKEHEILFLEGQGAISHPLYSGVTLSMLHGFAPHACILCHQHDRTIMRGTPSTPVPHIVTAIDLYERLAAPVFSTQVIGISVNTFGLNDDQARLTLDQIYTLTGLPVTDVVRFGPSLLVDAILSFKSKIDM
jgi:uncharacterized NAD-dependent epimerase/dehydratase family protein